jgi:hypothetical protein
MAEDERRAELSSLATILADVTGRVGAMAQVAAAGDEPFSPELYEIERGLLGATRRLTKLVDDLAHAGGPRRR